MLIIKSTLLNNINFITFFLQCQRNTDVWKNLRSSSKSGWIICEGLLILLKDTVSVMSDSLVHQVNATVSLLRIKSFLFYVHMWFILFYLFLLGFAIVIQ